MTMLEKMIAAIEREQGVVEMVLTSPAQLRRLTAERTAKAALRAIREPSPEECEMTRRVVGEAMAGTLNGSWKARIDAILAEEA